MRLLILAAFGLIFFGGCTKSPVLTPIQQAGCAIETAVSTGIGSAVASALQCSNASQVDADLQAAFGNANLCNAPVPDPAPPTQLKSAFKKLGDVSQSDLDAAKKGAKLKPMGAIGDVACPLAVSAAIGFLSNSVPKSWGCTGPNATIQGLLDAATAACKAAVPL